MKKNNFATAVAIISVACVVILLAGCGKKGDPICPTEPPPFAVSSVAVEDTGGLIRATWHVSGDASALRRIRIFRSDVAVDGSTCPGCPREYRSIADMLGDDVSVVRSGDDVYSFVDTSAKEGFIYSYRVAACSEDGRCATSSESTDILMRPTGANPQSLRQETK